MLRVAVIFVVVAFSGAASAQMEKLLRPPVAEDVFARAVALIRLSEEEAAAARQLYAAYADEYREKAGAFRELNLRLQRAANEKRPEVRELRAEFEAEFPRFVREKRRLEATLIADVRGLLSDAQIEEAWPKAERLFRRETLAITISQKATWWCRVDLFKLVDQVGLTDEERRAIGTILERYELDLDRPLAERQRMWDQDIARPPERREDPDLYRRNAELGNQIAALNRRVLRQIVELLPPGKGGELEELAYRVAYDNVYGVPRPAAAILKRALALPSLTADQRDRLRDLQAVYDSESAKEEAEGRAAYDRGDEEMESLAGLGKEAAAARVNAGEDPVSRCYREVAAARASFEEGFGGRVRSVLTAEQRAALKADEVEPGL